MGESKTNINELNKALRNISMTLFIIIVIISVISMIKSITKERGPQIFQIENNKTLEHEFIENFDDISVWTPTYPENDKELPIIKSENGIMIITPKNGSWVYRDINPPMSISNKTCLIIRSKATTGIGIALVVDNSIWVNFDTDNFKIDGEWHVYKLCIGNYSGHVLTSIGLRTDGNGAGSSYWDYIKISSST